MWSADDQAPRLPALEHLIRAHIKALHEFIRTVYPEADADRCIDDTFESAGAAEAAASDQHVRLRLFRLSREHIRRRVPPEWLRQNLQAVRSRLRDRVSRVADGDARAEVIRMTSALASLSEDAQEILLISAALNGDSSEDLALVLGTTPETARYQLLTARQAMELAYNNFETPQASTGGDDQ